MPNDDHDEEAGPAADVGQGQRQSSSIPSFLVVMLLIYILTSHNGDEFLARHQYQDGLRSLSWQLSNFTAWMNGTASNFTVPDRDSDAVALQTAFVPSGVLLNPLHSSYYSNISGFIDGDAKLYNISPPAIPALNESFPWRLSAEGFTNGTNVTLVPERLGTWNWTASDRAALRIVEKAPSSKAKTNVDIALVHGRIELTDSSKAEDLRLDFEGLHFVSNGSIYGLADPSGNIDIRLLPSLVPELVRNDSARVLIPELEARVEKLKELIDAGIIDQDTNSGSGDPAATTCSFIVFAQLHPLPVPEDLMQELENEIQNPTGLSTIWTPKLSVDMLLLSRECGIMYSVKNTEGVRSRIFFRRVTTYAGLASIILLVLLTLHSRQVARAHNPSSISRLSRWTFLIQSILDSVTFSGHITFAVLTDGRASLSLVAPAFLACILFFYESQFAVLIYQIQAPEESVPAPTAPVVSTPIEGETAAASATTLPPPTTQPNPPVASPSFWAFFWHHIRTDPRARLYMISFLIITLLVRIILSPTLSLLFVSVSYSAIWMPQIVRSVRRGRSSGLSVEYVVGVTACRILLALYFLACPTNVLDIDPRPWVYLLAVFVFLEALWVILQNTFGPRLFLPKRFARIETYNYHSPLPLSKSGEADPEQAQSLGDCAICMDSIMVDAFGLAPKEKGTQDQSGTYPPTPSVTQSAGLLAGAVTRKAYALAPCHHLFHTDCLETWLAIKNICPQCRRPLPPL